MYNGNKAPESNTTYNK